MSNTDGMTNFTQQFLIDFSVDKTDITYVDWAACAYAIYVRAIELGATPIEPVKGIPKFTGRPISTYMIHFTADNEEESRRIRDEIADDYDIGFIGKSGVTYLPAPKTRN